VAGFDRESCERRILRFDVLVFLFGTAMIYFSYQFWPALFTSSQVWPTWQRDGYLHPHCRNNRLYSTLFHTRRITLDNPANMPGGSHRLDFPEMDAAL